MRSIAVLLASWVAATPPSGPVVVHASASCAPATKPGRIKCRAIVELPLGADAKIAWSELRIVASGAAIAPLRGRLGPLDAEAREDGRVVWSFSVAAASPGDHAMTVRLLSTIEPAPGGAPTLSDKRLDVPIRVAP